MIQQLNYYNKIPLRRLALQYTPKMDLFQDLNSLWLAQGRLLFYKSFLSNNQIEKLKNLFTILSLVD